MMTLTLIWSNPGDGIKSDDRMKPIVVTKKIAAPIDSVFRTVAEINRFSKAIPHIVRVEFISEEKSGLGTQFRETRSMRGREFSTVLEITEFAENEHVRIVSDSHGTVWDTLFTVEPEDAHTILKMEMTATPKKLAAKASTRLMRPMVAKAVAADMESVKTYCEELAQQG